MADWYAERLAAGSAPHQLAMAAVLQLLPAVTDLPVLDLGCGEGLAARALATRGARVTGIDLSEQMIGHARRQETTHPGSGARPIPRASAGPATGTGHLATHLNALIEAGFAVTRVLEPEPTSALALSHPGRADVPMSLVVRAARQPSLPTQSCPSPDHPHPLAPQPQGLARRCAG